MVEMGYILAPAAGERLDGEEGQGCAQERGDEKLLGRNEVAECSEKGTNVNEIDLHKDPRMWSLSFLSSLSTFFSAWSVL